MIEDACAGISPYGVADAHHKFACERVEMVASSGDMLSMIPERTVTLQDDSSNRILQQIGRNEVAESKSKLLQSLQLDCSCCLLELETVLLIYVCLLRFLVCIIHVHQYQR